MFWHRNLAQHAASIAKIANQYPVDPEVFITAFHEIQKSAMAGKDYCEIHVAYQHSCSLMHNLRKHGFRVVKCAYNPFPDKGDNLIIRWREVYFGS